MENITKAGTPARENRIINAFTMRPSSYQILSYMLLIMQAAIYYSSVQPLIKVEKQWLGFLIANTIVLVLTLTMGLVASCIDPSAKVRDPSQSSNSSIITFYGCTKCCKDYPADVVHCWRCERCVEEYSHHCAWPNNCIGQRNYRWYVSMLVFGLCNHLLFLIAGAIISKTTSFED